MSRSRVVDNMERAHDLVSYFIGDCAEGHSDYLAITQRTNNMKAEKKVEVLNLIVIIALFIIECVVGKYVMNGISNSWISITATAVGVFLVGEELWDLIRIKIVGRGQKINV